MRKVGGKIAKSESTICFISQYAISIRSFNINETCAFWVVASLEGYTIPGIATQKFRKEFF